MGSWSVFQSENFDVDIAKSEKFKFQIRVMQNLNLWLKTFREQQRVSMIKNNQIREPDQRFFPSKDKKKNIK